MYMYYMYNTYLKIEHVYVPLHKKAEAKDCKFSQKLLKCIIVLSK